MPDTSREGDLDKQNIWGERSFFYNCHRDGGDFTWFANNLSSAPGSPEPSRITAAWTFDGKWDPENESGPVIQQLRVAGKKIALVFSEPVTVKGQPRVRMRGGDTASYSCGSGTDTLSFELGSDDIDEVTAVDLNGGAIIGCRGSATSRLASLVLRCSKQVYKKSIGAVRFRSIKALTVLSSLARDEGP